MREAQEFAWMSEATLAGVPVVRACVTSYRTTEKDIVDVVGVMNALAAELAVCATR